ncbi:hypothetical protein UFOVP1116_18 [uncultured Caudovirales phage]|uniref:Uncharacterized protein n=1 Tax=uncultured Caudovirales phage TaxID=2100421 RepID=A0A6J5S6S4_9CAUD|nr:hypothetical protein UFOVP1116_18 [uncultured Caudovirales phage]CAB4204161.1 hypothetical protein UFOVP1391_38 [uncultured Caudovirales phage]CAB4215498.1 hypothetical protein UFOVP1480_21 [uncultured Caudovirales phage]CAB5230033.1 hypothetical protein UFOVP1568_31 [uncultured Caudovirales phage]
MIEISRIKTTLEEQKAESAKFQIQEKLEGETLEQYVARLTAEYKAKMSDAAPPALFNRAVLFIQAMASKVFEVPASEAVQSERLNVCYSCQYFLVAFDVPEQVGHCAACGCAKNKMSSLPEKAKIKKSSCPKNLWDVTIDPVAVALPLSSTQK